jgi:hypothetical protein
MAKGLGNTGVGHPTWAVYFTGPKFFPTVGIKSALLGWSAEWLRLWVSGSGIRSHALASGKKYFKAVSNVFKFNANNTSMEAACLVRDYLQWGWTVTIDGIKILYQLVPHFSVTSISNVSSTGQEI